MVVTRDDSGGGYVQRVLDLAVAANQSTQTLVDTISIDLPGIELSLCDRRQALGIPRGPLFL